MIALSEAVLMHLKSRLTERDKLVLKKIGLEGFQTIQELRKGPLGDVTREHSWALMKKLVYFGFLREIKGDGKTIRAWALTSLAQRELSELFSPGAKIYQAPSFRDSLSHDVVVREVKDILGKSKAVTEWIPEHALKAQVMSRLKHLSATERISKLELVPDSLFTLRDKTKLYKIALEVELTRKSKKRLYKKIESHLVSKNFDFAFFVLGSNVPSHFFLSILNSVLETSSRVRFSEKQNGIYFCELKKIRAENLDVKFHGIKDAVKISTFG